MLRLLGSAVLSVLLCAVVLAARAHAEPAPHQDSDFADMTPRARTAAIAGLPAAPLGAPPATVRVWRRRLDHSTSSCSGRVDVIPFEDYVKGVLPNEWISSWDDKALEMGAVCARTFAWWWVVAGGKYPCADVDDTTASQVYTETRVARTDGAVDRTAGVAAVKDGALVFAEYSAENGDPTADGVDEPYCAGQTVNGHGHGVCQWGTQRWATKEGRDYHWMVAHYYPGAVAAIPGAPAPAWGAALVAAPAALQVAAGGTADVGFDVTNTGTAAWDGIALVASSASPLAGAEWVSAAEPVTLSAAPGQTVHVTFVVHAPLVTSPTPLDAAFALAQGGQTFTAADFVTIAVDVLAATAPPPAPPDAGTASELHGDASGGCEVAPRGDGGGLALLAVALGLTRRRRGRAAAR